MSNCFENRSSNDLMKNAEKYNIRTGKQERNRLKLLNPGQMPYPQALLSIASLYEVEIRVFHDMPTPFVYRPNTNSGNAIYLQCLSHMHYNPLDCRKAIKDISDDKLVNMVQTLCHKDE